MATKAQAEVASRAARPSAAASACTAQPVLMPSAAATPPRQPNCNVRVTVYNRSTPGVALSTSAVAMNSGRSCAPNIVSPLRRVVPKRQVHCAERPAQCDSQGLQRQRGGFAAADAQCCHAALAASLAQRAEQCDDDAGARGADRMAERA